MGTCRSVQLSLARVAAKREADSWKGCKSLKIWWWRMRMTKLTIEVMDLRSKARSTKRGRMRLKNGKPNVEHEASKNAKTAKTKIRNSKIQKNNRRRCRCQLARHLDDWWPINNGEWVDTPPIQAFLSDLLFLFRLPDQHAYGLLK